MNTWDDNDIIWNNNTDFVWNSVYEITAETTPVRGAMFYNKEHKTKYKKWPAEEKKYIKILCVIYDEKFEDWKYINKKLKIQSFDEELTIKDIKKVNISEEGVKYEMVNTDIVDNKKELIFNIEERTEIKKITVKVKNIEKYDIIHR